MRFLVRGIRTTHEWEVSQSHYVKSKYITDKLMGKPKLLSFSFKDTVLLFSLNKLLKFERFWSFFCYFSGLHLVHVDLGAELIDMSAELTALTYAGF